MAMGNSDTMSAGPINGDCKESRHACRERPGSGPRRGRASPMVMPPAGTGTEVATKYKFYTASRKDRKGRGF